MTELQHQIAVIKWAAQPTIRKQYPCLKLLYHIANERQCTPAMGKLLKLAGVKKGVPDLHLPVPRGQYHGLYIEMKDEDGMATSEQLWWGVELMEQGYYCEVCHGYQSAIRVIEWYLNLKEATI